MSHRAALSGVLAAVLGAGLAAQATTSTMPADNKFLDGWMAELLHADRDAAVRSYTAAMKASDLPNFQSELATMRLWESSWMMADRQKYAEALGEKGVYPARGVNTWFIRRLDADAFTAALVNGDTAELDRLRDRLAETTQQYKRWVRDPRPLVSGELNNFRGETVQVDAELEALKKQFRDAKDAGDAKKAHEIRLQIYARQRTMRRTASRRVVAKRLAEMTRLHLEGHHERASGMENILYRRQRFPASARIRQIRGWSADHQRDRAAQLLEDLDAQLQLRELLSEERAVLRALRQRIVDLRAAGQHEQALVLAAQTPYRSRLFPGR